MSSKGNAASKQTSIASFFGNRGKASTTAAEASESGEAGTAKSPPSASKRPAQSEKNSSSNTAAAVSDDSLSKAKPDAEAESTKIPAAPPVSEHSPEAKDSGGVRKFFMRGSQKTGKGAQDAAAERPTPDSPLAENPALGSAGATGMTDGSRPGPAVGSVLVGKPGDAKGGGPGEGTGSAGGPVGALSSSESEGESGGGVLGMRRKGRRTRNGKRLLVLEDEEEDSAGGGGGAVAVADHGVVVNTSRTDDRTSQSLEAKSGQKDLESEHAKSPAEAKQGAGKDSTSSFFKRRKAAGGATLGQTNTPPSAGELTGEANEVSKKQKRCPSPKQSKPTPSPPENAKIDKEKEKEKEKQGEDSASSSESSDAEEGEGAGAVLVVEEGEEGAVTKGRGGQRPSKGKGGLQVKGAKYDVRGAATWKDGGPVPFLFLADLLERIANESGRLLITEMLCNALRTVMLTSPDDLLPTVYLAANRVAPPHEGVELGIGDATIIKALAEATGRKEQQVKSEYKESGDLGLVAKASRTTQRTMLQPKPLTIRGVFDAFHAIAKETGSQSGDKKRGRIKQLLVSARQNEPQFIVRLLQGKMRIGLAEQTVLAALAQAAVFHVHDREQEGKASEKPAGEGGEGQESDEKASEGRNAWGALRNGSSRVTPEKLEEAVGIMKHAYSVLPVYDHIIPVLMDPAQGIWHLQQRCRFTLGVPVGPMLAKPTRGISEILDKFQGKTFTCEYKYDGERAQIHCLEDGTVQVYSRNAECNTTKYPDVVQAVLRRRKEGVKSFVLDAEAVAYDREKERILPFQVLSTRARKGVAEEDIKVRVCVYAFDLLSLNGQDLLQEQLQRRRELLYESFTEEKGEFQFATATTSNDTEELLAFVNDAVAHGCEGAMVKTLDENATYEPAKRSNNWLKLKKDYMDGLGDSLDLVPIGAFVGRGKRAGVYGAFLLACYDPNKEEFQSICKIGTGFSEVMLEERSASLRKEVIDAPLPYYRYGETLPVDVWFKPSEVWEVKAADLSISPVHQAAQGLVDESKGIALRFPRFLRVRDDKSTEQATSAEQVVDMFRAQSLHSH